MKKKYSIIFKVILFISLAAVFVSCSESADTSTDSLSTAARDGTQADKNENAEVEKQPDTIDIGLEEKPEAKGTFIFPQEGARPYAVMIDNEGSRPLPQGGLHCAQVIYEIIAEGGVTRLMPLFWGTNPEMIGPVRSSRHYFLDYAMEHDAIYVHFGWSPMAIKDIDRFKINNIDGYGSGGAIFWDLTNDKKNWQDSYTSMEKIREFAKRAKYKENTEKKPVFSYNKEDVEPVNGQEALKVGITYSSDYTCGFEYDEDSKEYLRFRKEAPQMERVSGKQLSAKNIIIQYVKNYTIKGDTAGRQQVETVGSGSGWLITCGKAVKIKWSKESRATATRYTDESGSQITLNPGQTWIQILPLTGKVVFK